MAAEAAALLDQLMGAYRDVGPDENVRQREWSDPEVCKCYLCGFCPSELFTNTKSDVGPCDKVHDESLKKAYEDSDRRGKMGYETEFLNYLEKLVKDLDRRIVRGRERLRKSAEAKQQTLHGATGPTSERMKHLSAEINHMVLDLERLGAMGRLEEAQSLMRRVEDMERERERERHILSSKTLAGFEVDANDFHEKMELCDVCGSFLVIGDTQSRVDAHLLGKQHLGYARIRTAITELRRSREELVRTREEERMRERRERRQSRRSRSRSRDRQQSRSQDRRRSRSRDKHRRHSHRSRSRSRDRDRDKDRERTRGKGREKNGDEGGKDRDKDRDKNKEKVREKGKETRAERKTGTREDREREERDKEKRRDSDRDRGKGKDKEQERRKSSPHSRERAKEDLGTEKVQEDGKVTEEEDGEVA